MMPSMRQLVIASIGLFVFSAEGALAQSYPNRPVAIVVPAAAGGPTDAVARLIASAMSTDLGQRVIVENIVGAGGTIGTARVAKAMPDGYTLLLYNIGMATAATLYRNLPYDTLAAFEYIGLVTEVPMTIVARSNFEPKDLKDLIRHVRARGEEITYANAGQGTSSHLCGMLLMSAIGTKLTTIPYKGTAPAMADILGGQVDLMCDQTTNTMNQIKERKVKVYAVTTTRRLDVLPDVPTAEEAGLDHFQLGAWHGFYAPKGTAGDVVDRLSASLRKSLKDNNVIKQFAALATTPATQEEATPTALRTKLESEIARWAPVIRAAGTYAN
jgi:tripartite-type tricarboxylate transporter receptor subunit TctC